MKEFTFPYVWIERKYRQECLQYTDTSFGIRLKFDDGIDYDLIHQVNKLVLYLRKNYYFPVRCNICITNHRRYHSKVDGHIYYGIFYDNADVCPKRKIYPQIFVAGQLWEHRETDDVLFAILHELTHYYQWFFDEEEKRTDRSLEIEANKWAQYILDRFRDNE